MENLLMVVYEWRYIIAILICGVVYSIFEWSRVRGMAYQCIISAKQLAKEKILNGGQEQEDWVVAKLTLLLPKSITLFLGEDMIRQLVKKLYIKAMDLIDDGQINNSFNK